MSSTLKVGVVGVGGIAKVHYPGWMESPHAELVALADINGDVLKKFGEKLGVGLLYEKPEELFANEEIDIVDICVPNRVHAPLTIAALEAGKHVICEKPLSILPEEIEAMIRARDESGKLLMTAQHFRYDGRAIALKKEIDNGTLGQVYHARSWMLRRSNIPLWGGYCMKEVTGGGALLDIGVHILDLTMWLMGFPKPVSISGVTETRLARMPGAFSAWGDDEVPSGLDTEEFAAALVRFDNGAHMVLEVSWLLNHKTENEDMQIWLYGEQGGAHWPKNEVYKTNYQTHQHLNVCLKRADGGEPHAKECIAFAEAVAEGKPSPVPPEESLKVARIIDGVYRSAAAGQEVRFD